MSVDSTTWLIKKLTPALEMEKGQRQQYLQHLGRVIKTSVALSGRNRILENLRDLCKAGTGMDQNTPVVQDVWETLLEELGEEELLH